MRKRRSGVIHRFSLSLLKARMRRELGFGYPEAEANSMAVGRSCSVGFNSWDESSLSVRFPTRDGHRARMQRTGVRKLSAGMTDDGLSNCRITGLFV